MYPGSPTAHSTPGAGNQQQFVAGVDLEIPFRCGGCVLLGTEAARLALWMHRAPSSLHSHPASALHYAPCHCRRLRSADELRTTFTNHVQGYQGLLDYIW